MPGARGEVVNYSVLKVENSSTSASHEFASGKSKLNEGSVLRNLGLGEFIGRNVPFDPRQPDFADSWKNHGIEWHLAPQVE